MAHFCFREIAVHHPSNRGKFLQSKEVIQYPFSKENRFKEMWRGIYMFKSNQPKEGDSAFGDFYMEVDEANFPKLKRMILTATEYLQNQYGFRSEHLNFFSTNRSIWISIPSKVFNCYGKTNLHKIHKLMAEEVHSHLLSSGFSNGLDLSIYRWNGLMRGLGSYLPEHKRWVTKFNLSDLEEAVSMDDLSGSKFDNGFTYEDVQPLSKAVRWFKHCETKLFKEKNQKPVRVQNQHKGMEEFIERGELPFNRNLHIYSTALYLKDKGLEFSEAVDVIKTKIKDAYVNTREAFRTIQSAFKGNKHFAPMSARTYLDERIFEEYTSEKKSFIVPRTFITTLHENKAHYQSYKHLFSILHMHQIHREPLKIDLTGYKYKKQELGYFEKLQKVGFISYEFKNNVVTASLIHQPRETYKSHIVVPNQFVKSKTFKNLKREFILLAELWRGSFRTSEEKFTYFFNMKSETIQKNIGMLQGTVQRYVSILKKMRLIIGSFILPISSKQEYKSILYRGLPKKTSWKLSFLEEKEESAKIEEKPILKVFLKDFSLIIKCNYST